MTVTVNGKPRELPEGITVRELADTLHYRRASVWLNGRQLLASEFPITAVKPGDDIKILRIVGGG